MPAETRAVTAEQNQALQDLLELHPDVWYHNATRFTCTEADVIANLLDAFGRSQEAEELLTEHATGDQPYDRHELVLDADGAPAGYKIRQVRS